MKLLLSIALVCFTSAAYGQFDVGDSMFALDVGEHFDPAPSREKESGRDIFLGSLTDSLRSMDESAPTTDHEGRSSEPAIQPDIRSGDRVRILIGPQKGKTGTALDRPKGAYRDDLWRIEIDDGDDSKHSWAFIPDQGLSHINEIAAQRSQCHRDAFGNLRCEPVRFETRSEFVTNAPATPVHVEPEPTIRPSSPAIVVQGHVPVQKQITTYFYPAGVEVRCANVNCSIHGVHHGMPQKARGYSHDEMTTEPVVYIRGRRHDFKAGPDTCTKGLRRHGNDN